MWILDRIDGKILRELEADGRLSFAELGERAGLSKSPCWARVRDLQKAGVIEGFGARINPGALGLAVQCLVNVQIDFGADRAFEAAVIDHPGILECHTIAGDSDYVLRIHARSVEHLDEMLRNDLTGLPGVQRFSTTVCLKPVKARASLARWAEMTA
ncbi:MAG: Lrp/AsnC family transcriptional regulator [Blastomonas sp.]